MTPEEYEKRTAAGEKLCPICGEAGCLPMSWCPKCKESWTEGNQVANKMTKLDRETPIPVYISFENGHILPIKLTQTVINNIFVTMKEYYESNSTADSVVLISNDLNNSFPLRVKDIVFISNIKPITPRPSLPPRGGSR